MTYFQRRSTPGRIVDILETTGEAFTVDSLHTELAWRFEPVPDRIVWQALQRIAEKGVAVESDGVWRLT